jgi:glycosyltransferase involved in cell wall biosynthesis
MLDYNKIELNKILVEIDDTNLINHIVLTGYVVNTDLLAIRNATSFISFTARRFWYSMLEAMSCNVPVIASNTSSMPEVWRSSAYY